tara:strand:- start:104 stop:394 length:291 start_codon:yes stop_codon:yes gene_type:complete
VKTTEEVRKMNSGQLVSWFMMASYAYYQLDVNLMSDYDFDFLVERLRNEWDNVNHPHKDLIKKTNLDAGSGYDIDFPTIVRGAVADYLQKNNVISL